MNERYMYIYIHTNLHTHAQYDELPGRTYIYILHSYTFTYLMQLVLIFYLRSQLQYYSIVHSSTGHWFAYVACLSNSPKVRNACVDLDDEGSRLTRVAIIIACPGSSSPQEHSKQRQNLRRAVEILKGLERCQLYQKVFMIAVIHRAGGPWR